MMKFQIQEKPAELLTPDDIFARHLQKYQNSYQNLYDTWYVPEPFPDLEWWMEYINAGGRAS